MSQRDTTAIAVDLREGMHFESVGLDGVAVALDSDPEHGGAGKGFRPMELLLVGLGSCTGMDVLSILRKKRQHVTAYRIEVTGTPASDYPHIFTDIAIRHILHGHSLRPEDVRRAIDLSETKYCPAYAMLSRAAAITSDFEIHPAEPPD